jgi:hypothetical protein
MNIIVVALKLVITVNFLLSFYYGVKNYNTTKSHTWLFLSMSLGVAFVLSSIRFLKEFFYTQFDVFEHIIVVLELVKINLIPFVTAFLLAAAITISRERISVVIPLRKSTEPMPQYGLERGTIYLVEEETPTRSYQLFMDLISCGYRGLGILRTHPDEVRKEYDIDVPILWMSRLQVGENAVYPNVSVIEQIIEEFFENGEKNVILLERLDYLISQQGFDTTLKFIQTVSSLVYVTRSVVLLHIDPLTIGERELKLIEKETKKIEKSIELEEELLELLLYVYEKNRRGIKPNLKQVTKDLSLSRNTARKRINQLRLKSFVVLKEKGRQKILEITPMGKNVITK